MVVLLAVVLIWRRPTGLWKVFTAVCADWLLLYWPDINLTTHAPGATESVSGWKVGAVGASVLGLAVLLAIERAHRKRFERGFDVVRPADEPALPTSPPPS